MAVVSRHVQAMSAPIVTRCVNTAVCKAVARPLEHPAPEPRRATGWDKHVGGHGTVEDMPTARRPCVPCFLYTQPQRCPNAVYVVKPSQFSATSKILTFDTRKPHVASPRSLGWLIDYCGTGLAKLLTAATQKNNAASSLR